MTSIWNYVYGVVDEEVEDSREKNIVSKFLLASLSTVDTAK